MQVDYFGELKVKLETAIADKDEATVQAIEKEVGRLFPLFVQDLHTAAVDSINTSVAAYKALEYIDPNKGLTIIEAMVMRFQEEKPQLPISRLMSRKLASIKGLDIGVEAPDFSLYRDQGIQVKLSDFRGQYLYVDFWASWCLACRAENPKLVKIYEDYHGKKFTMLGIGIKDKEAAWLEAIKKDELPWTQLRDVNNEVAELYHIQSLPQNLLLDPNGIIIARNLNAPELRKALEKMIDQ